MRIGNNMDMPAAEQLQVARTANYSKADIISNSIRLDITDIGKDTGLIIDQGRSMQDVIDEAGALDVKTQTDYMVVMSNTMSEEDYARMCKEGFHPGEMTGEESVTILDHIKTVMAQSGEVVAGFNDDMDAATLEAVTGSKADANSLAKAMKQADIPLNEANAKKINEAAREIEEVSDISDSAIRYMLVQNQRPTIENVYLANFSASGSGAKQATGYYSLGMQGYLAKQADTADIASIMPDIRKTVEAFELEDIDIETGVKEATWLVEKGLDITKSNIVKLDALMNTKLPEDYGEACRIAANALSRGDEPKKADLGRDTENIYDKAVRIAEDTEAVTDKQVETVVSSGKVLNLKNLWNAQEYFGVSVGAKETLAGAVPNEITATGNVPVANGQALLAEVRLRMTLDANVSMLKRGIQIDTLPLSRLVDELRTTQQRIDEVIVQKTTEREGQNISSDRQGIAASTEIYKATRQAVAEIPFVPAAVIGRLKLEQEYSLTTVHETGTDMKARYEAAGQSYEALMTAPRRDMGDSISKAFRNVDDILSDMRMPVNDENRKAVRILGYNSMEISESNIDRIREATQKVTNAVNALTPAKTLELIRQGINPMEMGIDELTDVLSKLSTQEADEKYSRFLYKLEKSGGISDSEREAYIGIYRLVNRLEKTDAAAVGSLVNSDRDITFKSLLSGMRSRKISFNETIDDDYGLLQDTVQKGISISDQIEQAFAKVTGKDADDKLSEEYMKESYREYMQTLSENIPEADALLQRGETVTVNNMAASHALASSDENVFKLLKKYERSNEEKNGIDKEAMSGYETAVRELIDGFEDRDSAKKAYSSVIDLSKQMIEDIRYTADNTIDLKQMTMCFRQLTIASARADREEYTVPVQIGDEMTAVNLTLRHEEGSKGEVFIGFDHEVFGRVTAHFTADEQRISGMLVTENREGLDILNRVSSGMSAKADRTIDIRAIIGRETDNGSKYLPTNADINNVDTKTLYGLAKDFLTEFSSLMQDA